MPNVTNAPVVQYDHHSVDYARRHAEIVKDMLETKPVAWSDTYGGFWVLSRYADARRVLEDWKTFSSENRGDPNSTVRTGILIPPAPVPIVLNESDPPLHTRRRMIEAPYFTPKYLGGWVKTAQEYTRRALDEVIETGEMELINDLALKVPAMTTLHVGGVDPSDWKYFAYPETIYGAERVEEAHLEIKDKLVHLLRQRREDPRDDLATGLARAAIDGEPLDLQVAAGMLHTVVTGGFDTATSLLSNAMDWMDRNPEGREFLRANPDKMENAVEEFLRSFPPLTNIARNATVDVEIGGHTIQAGDRVLISLHAANHDPEKFESPDEMRFDRENAREHLAYTAGNHRCLGSPLARIELRHVLNEVLRRIPDFSFDRARSQRVETIGVVNNWSFARVTFSPGSREVH